VHYNLYFDSHAASVSPYMYSSDTGPTFRRRLAYMHEMSVGNTKITTNL